MRKPDPTARSTPTRGLMAATPAALAAVAVMGVALSAGSTSGPVPESGAAAVARAAGADLSDQGLRSLTAGFDPATLSLAMRHDPAGDGPRLSGLTPGWESLTIAGKPSLDPDAVSGSDALRLNEAMRAQDGALRPARPFRLNAALADRQRALRCLTQSVYYEAALENATGQAAVAQVVLNRVRDPNYPASVCGVVFEGAARTTGCQFSFTCDGSLANAPVPWAWNRARGVAERALAGHVAAEVGTATHYHADYVHPWWAPTLTKIRQIGAHIFYRWNGALGDTGAFVQAYAGREPVIDEARFSRPRLLVASSAGDAAVEAPRTVEINGVTRVVGVASLGGRRQPSPDDIAAINARLAAFEAAELTPAPRETAPPPGVTPMDVVEVGRPAG